MKKDKLLYFRQLQPDQVSRWKFLEQQSRSSASNQTLGHTPDAQNALINYESELKLSTTLTRTLQTMLESGMLDDY